MGLIKVKERKRWERESVREREREGALQLEESLPRVAERYTELRNAKTGPLIKIYTPE